MVPPGRRVGGPDPPIGTSLIRSVLPSAIGAWASPVELFRATAHAALATVWAASRAV
jgi:hypothetical protein